MVMKAVTTIYGTNESVKVQCIVYAGREEGGRQAGVRIAAGPSPLGKRQDHANCIIIKLTS